MVSSLFLEERDVPLFFFFGKMNRCLSFVWLQRGYEYSVYRFAVRSHVSELSFFPCGGGDVVI